MNRFSRRAFTACTLFGSPAWLSACGGGGGSEAALDTPAPPAPPGPVVPPVVAAPEWNVEQAVSLLADGGTSFDLATTLPASVLVGGRFSVSGRGTALPPGVVLSAAGQLSAAPGAHIGPVDGVIFVYDEP